MAPEAMASNKANSLASELTPRLAPRNYLALAMYARTRTQQERRSVPTTSKSLRMRKHLSHAAPSVTPTPAVAPFHGIVQVCELSRLGHLFCMHNVHERQWHVCLPVVTMHTTREEEVLINTHSWRAGTRMAHYGRARVSSPPVGLLSPGRAQRHSKEYSFFCTHTTHTLSLSKHKPRNSFTHTLAETLD